MLDISIKRVTTALDFGPKANYLVLLIGHLGQTANSTYGYKAYRANPNMDLTAESENLLPPLRNWKLFNESTLSSGIFWPESVQTYDGMTFDQTTDTIFIAVTNGSSHIYYRKLPQNGNFTPFESKITPRTYFGLIAWKGKIYGLADNKFYLLGSDGPQFTEIEEVFNFDISICELIFDLNQ